MNPIGNDIVDLKSPEAKGKSKDLRFINKTLNSRERDFVLNSDHPDAMLWVLWAAKESAYKAVIKSDPTVSSAPRQYSAQLDPIITADTAAGVVVTPGGPVRVKIVFCDDYVHCLGILGPAEKFLSIVSEAKPVSKMNIGGKSISEIESAAVRRLATKGIATCLQIPERDISIIRHKENNTSLPPRVYAKGYPNFLDISLSHDGRFASYAFLTT